MAFGLAALAIISTVVSAGAAWLGYESQKSAAETAAESQEKSAELAIEEQRRQFDEMQKTLSPYVNAGNTALDMQMKMLGIGTDSYTGQVGYGYGQTPYELQQSVVNNIEASPIFQSLMEQGEQAILQNAAATGGYRGSDVKNALARYRPALLNQQLNTYYDRLAGLSSMGQAAAAQQASSGQTTSSNISDLLTQIGAAQAGSALATGNAASNLYNQIGQSIGWGTGLYTLGQLGTGTGNTGTTGTNDFITYTTDWSQ